MDRFIDCIDVAQSTRIQMETVCSHRVGNIQELFDFTYWNHVRTHENPADISSRGLNPRDLVNNSLWFNGPQWLLLNNENWPKLELSEPKNVDLEGKQVNIHVNLTKTEYTEPELLLKFNSLVPLLRQTALILRLVHQARKTEVLKYSKTFITVAELNRARIFWIKLVQTMHFKKDIKRLKADKCVEENSKLKSLNPKVNDNDILIVHGRLQFADYNTT